jgi:hypothetical protein
MGRPRLYTAVQLRERQNAARRLARQERRPARVNHTVATHDRPPPQAVAERDLVYAAMPTLHMRLLGDPPPGRSALDQQGGAHVR